MPAAAAPHLTTAFADLVPPAPELGANSPPAGASQAKPARKARGPGKPRPDGYVRTKPWASELLLQPRALDLSAVDIPPDWHDYARVLVHLVLRWHRFHKDSKWAKPLTLTRDYIAEHVPKEVVAKLSEAMTGPGKPFTWRNGFQHSRPAGLNFARQYSLAEELWVRSWSKDATVYQTEDSRICKRFRDRRDLKRCGLVGAYPDTALALERWVREVRVLSGQYDQSGGKDWAYEALLARQPWLTVCKQGRLHTPLTCLRRDLRHRVRLRGKPVWCVDVKSSQPLLFALTLRQWLTNNPELCARLSDCHEYFAKIMLNRGTNGADNPEDSQREGARQVPTYCQISPLDSIAAFISKCVAPDTEEGIYEALMPAVDAARRTARPSKPVPPAIPPSKPVPPATRDEVKEGCLAWMYGNPAYSKEVGRAADKLFPMLNRTVVEYKRENGGHEVAAQNMQRLEAKIMLDGAARILTEEHPDLPFFTVHDAVCAAQEDMDVVREAVARAWREVLDVEPFLPASKQW